MIRTELQTRLPNSPGSLAHVAAVLTSLRIHILALSLESNGVLRLLVDRVEAAYAALTAEHMRVDKREVIVSVLGAPSLATLLETIANAGINVDYAYTTSVDANSLLTAVIGVENAMAVSTRVGL